jgi:DNA topoisomerase-1
MNKGQSIENITLEEALGMFQLPREIGSYENEQLLVSIGRFGPYVRHKNQFYSLEKTDDPLSIDQERAIELIHKKRIKDKEKVIKAFSEDKAIQILKGRYGAYIAKGRKNYRIPKDKNAADLSLEECRQIIAHADEKQESKRKK